MSLNEGDVYFGNMANALHEVHRRDQIAGDRAPPLALDFDGAKQVAIMLRTCTFPGLGRTTKNPPGPKIVWQALSLELHAAFCSEKWQLPSFSDVLREYHKILEE